MAGRKWTTDEDEFLTEHYGKSTVSELVSRLQRRSWDAVKLHAAHLGLSFYAEGVHPNVESNLSVLLENTPLSFYWMGFLAADGCFSTKRLKLTLAYRDMEHVVKFANYISCSGHCRYDNKYEVRAQDAFTIPKILEKFRLNRAKTYHPPDITWMSDELFLAFFVGFVDGDGCIKYQTGRKDCVLQIKVHSSWLENLQIMSDWISELAGISPVKANINNSGYASVVFGNCILLRFLKKKVQEMQLPVLCRKWNKIDENRVSRYEIAKQNRVNVLAMKQLGLRNVEIAKILRLSQACVSVIIKQSKGNKAA